MAKFEISVAAPGPPFFSISVVEGPVSQIEQTLLDDFSTFLGGVPKTDPPRPALKEVIARAREIAEEGFIRGDVLAARTKLEELQQNIKEQRQNRSNASDEPTGAFLVYQDRKNPRDIAFEVMQGIKQIPDDQSQLKADIESTLTSIQIMFPESETKSWFSRRSRSSPTVNKFSEYYTKLLALAQLGLECTPPYVSSARLALAGLQKEILDREGAAVKNAHIRRLLRPTGLMAVIMGLGYLVVREWAPPDWLIWQYRNFFLLIGGSAIGTWLSFSIRRVNLQFSDLAILEEDRLDPEIRVLFVTGLTVVIGLLFKLGIVLVTIGKFDTDFMPSGSKALLIGLLCGIGEKGLSTAVSRRATEVVERIGGSIAPTNAPR